jgi:cytochrome c oxidase subunit III
MSEPSSESRTLPRLPRGPSTAWGGMALLVTIELTAVSSLVVSYFYLRVGTTFWPPPGVDLPKVLKPAVETGLLLASLVPMRLGERAWARGNLGALRWLLPVVMGLVAAALVVKGLELAGLSYSWSSHAYGSIVWTMHGYSALHTVVLLGALAVLWLLLVRGHLDAELSVGVEVLALYTYFVGASALLTFATTTLSPHLL